MKKRYGLSGNSIKIIALSVMLLDHFCAAIIEKSLYMVSQYGIQENEKLIFFLNHFKVIYKIDVAIRMMGRMCFPILCFLLVEGFCHTHDMKKYLLRLLGFALLSEPVYDLTFQGKLFYWEQQNIFFTLVIALAALVGYRQIEKKDEWSELKSTTAKILLLIICCAIAYYSKADYGAYGILTVVLMYVFRSDRKLQPLIACIPLMCMGGYEYFTPACAIPLWCYNGERGMKMKYAFYFFYPVHLLIILGLEHYLGVQAIPYF